MKASLNECMRDFKNQLQKGQLQQAYRNLMAYMSELKTHLKNNHPEAFVSGGLYQGVMDMTYFSFVPAALKRRDLKIAIVFVYDAFRFEVWLSGSNRQVQARYWEIIRKQAWDRYPLVPDPTKADAILTHVLVEDPDFEDLQALTARIEQGTLAFAREVEAFLAALQD